jgi:hypothetical protein
MVVRSIIRKLERAPKKPLGNIVLAASRRDLAQEAQCWSAIGFDIEQLAPEALGAS